MSSDSRPLFWRAKHTPVELQAALRALAEEYPIREGTGPGTEIRFQPGADERSTVILAEGVATVHYDEVNRALRGVGTVLAGLVPEGGEYIEDAPFDSIGFMLDCSRNAVMKPEHVKRWLRRLALLGFNLGMLYTEDTYEIPGEEYFGYARGRYSGEELKDIDAYAASLGIRMIGCIQTLGHLEQILRWPAFRDVRDTDSVLLVGEEKTYKLIGEMLDATRDHFRSKRIHIGMDEAWSLGRGAGSGIWSRGSGTGDRTRPLTPGPRPLTPDPRPQSDIFIEHLNRVCGMCRDRGLRPMIWSDMLFVMGSPSGRYLDPQSRVPPEVVERIPKGLQLVYWDYFHGAREHYLDWIRRHQDLGFEPVVASGIWTWAQLWYNRELTEPNAGAAIDACREAEVSEILFTLWGDDGAYCDFDSALAGLAFAAERAFNPGANLAPRFRAICNASYENVIRACELSGPMSFAAILWDDPLLGIYHRHALTRLPPSWTDLEERFRLLSDDLSELPAENEAGDIRHAALLARVLAGKIALRIRLEQAYAARDRTGLQQVAAEIPGVTDALGQLAASWRRLWLDRNKPFGLETLQIRLAAQVARFQELRLRIGELTEGRVQSIPELETAISHPSEGISANWRNLAGGSVVL